MLCTNVFQYVKEYYGINHINIWYICLLPVTTVLSQPCFVSITRAIDFLFNIPMKFSIFDFDIYAMRVIAYTILNLGFSSCEQESNILTLMRPTENTHTIK